MENLVRLSQRPFQYIAIFCLLATLVVMLRLAVSFFYDFTVLPEIPPGLILGTSISSFMATLAVLALIGEFAIRNYINSQRKPVFIVRSMRRRNVI